MYRVYFFQDKKGNRPVADYLRDLAKKNDKTSRIKLQKILDYIDYLKEMGTRAGEPYVKHLGGELWELRPLRDRILFAAWDGKSFILLHHFMKDTRKTPLREIEQAKRNLDDIRERGLDDV